MGSGMLEIGLTEEGSEGPPSEEEWEVRISKLLLVEGMLGAEGVAEEFLVCFFQLETLVKPFASVLFEEGAGLGGVFREKSLKIWPCSWHFLH